MTKREALVSLNMALDIGSIRLGRLLEFFGTPENILKAPREKLMAVSGIGEAIAAKICALKAEDVDKELKEAQRLGLKIITVDDAEYPENLKNIHDPPIVLYVLGALVPEDILSLAIVGSRRASFYGLSAAEKFAFELAQKNITIVSGMARGIDTCAHKGALKAGGRTIAVIGSGFNRIYPEENKGLSEEIARAGAVLSEFPLNTEPFKQNFPRRNRVISGLSIGVIVVEAARNSGALITADFALEQGRDVFALPGKVDSATSFGTNALIKQGAKLVSCVDDIIEEIDLPLLSSAVRVIPQEKPEKSPVNPDLSLDEAGVCALLDSRPVALDELVEKTNMEIQRISGILLKLQLRKVIRELPGKLFVRNTHGG